MAYGRVLLRDAAQVRGLVRGAQPASFSESAPTRRVTVSASGALVISSRHSKTNQYGDRVTCIQLALVTPGPGRNLSAHVRPVSTPADFPAFSMLMAGAPAALPPDFVAAKQLVARMNGDAVAVRTSLRARGRDACGHTGVLTSIMRTGDWLRYLDYISAPGAVR
jgi:hypothetical protein